MPTSPAPAITPNRVPGIYCPHRRTAVRFPAPPSTPPPPAAELLSTLMPLLPPSLAETPYTLCQDIPVF